MGGEKREERGGKEGNKRNNENCVKEGMIRKGGGGEEKVQKTYKDHQVARKFPN